MCVCYAAATMSTNDPRYDGVLLGMAQAVSRETRGHGIEPLLDVFFSFLRRKTDFFAAVGVVRSGCGYVVMSPSSRLTMQPVTLAWPGLSIPPCDRNVPAKR